MAFVPKATKPPTIQRKSMKNWMKGTVTAFEDGRTPNEGLRSSGNMILEQDGVLRPRPSLVAYGPQPTGTILGEVAEYRTTSAGVTTNKLISLQNVAGTTKVYIADGDDSVWTVCDGKTYDNTAAGHFLQVDDKVLVMNGIDNLSYLDTSSDTVIPYTALSTPSAPTLDTLTGLTGTAFKVYYAITANSTVGQTAGSAVLTQQVSTDRDLWDSATMSVKIAWSAVTNAQSYNVYMGVTADGAGQPTMYLIAGGLNASILTFTDDGSRAQDVSQPMPSTDSTAGMKATRGAVVNGRPWLVGDYDNPYYVWRGGDFGFELDFSPANGGGYTPVGSGTKDIPNCVKGFRNAKGEAMVMVLSQGTNGSGKRSYLSPTTVTYGASTFVVWQVSEDSGQDGTDSPDGVIIYQNSAWYPSRDGFKTTGTKPQLQNVLSTDRVSNTIQTDIKNLSNSAMENCVGLAYEGRLYWAVPNGSTTNNEIWVLDLDRQGAWMKPWTVAADWLFLYNDNDGTTHFCALVDNEILEFTYGAATSDNGTAFATSASSGLIKFSEDSMEWAKVIDVTFLLQRPRGQINLLVAGKTEDNSLATVGTDTFIPNASIAGWSESGWGEAGWSEVVSVPTEYGSANEPLVIEVDEELQWLTWELNTATAGVDYQLSNVVIRYVPVGTKELN